jgi:hypothetical protein
LWNLKLTPHNIAWGQVDHFVDKLSYKDTGTRSGCAKVYEKLVNMAIFEDIQNDKALKLTYEFA